MQQNKDIPIIDKKDLENLAERIYDLDYEVYNLTGSSLGHVYGPDRNYAIKAIVNLLSNQLGSYEIINDLALISNMARTIEDKNTYNEVMNKYARIYLDTTRIRGKYSRIEIVDKKKITDAIPLYERYEQMEHKIICIGRTYGCGGSDIGFSLASRLGINYYDYVILDKVSERLEMREPSNAAGDVAYGKSEEGEPIYTSTIYKKPKKKFSFKQLSNDFIKFHGLPKRDAVFFNQSRLILDMARSEDFVIMGRSAARVLNNAGIPNISIFISAPMENRVERISQVFPDLSEKEVIRLIKKQDASKAKNYEYFNMVKWGSTDAYDLTINTASCGIMDTVDFIMYALKAHK